MFFFKYECALFFLKYKPGTHVEFINAYTHLHPSVSLSQQTIEILP